MVDSSCMTVISSGRSEHEEAVVMCDRIWEKRPYRAFKKNRVITTVGKSRL